MINGFSLARGTQRWAKRTGGLEDYMNQLISAVNTLQASGVTAAGFFNANVSTYAVDTTLTQLLNLQVLTFSAGSKALTLSAANTTFYAGGNVLIINAGTNAFAVKDNAGTTLIASVDPGECYWLVCQSISSAAGTWINVTQKILDMAMMQTQMFS